METKRILHELEYNRGYLPVKALRAAAEQREALEPRLLAALRECPKQVDSRGDRYFLFLHACYLSAQFRNAEALPPIVAFFSHPGEFPVDLCGNFVTEDLGRVLASVCGGETEPIASLALNPELSEWTRGAAIQAQAILYANGLLSRSNLVEFFTMLFHGGLRRETDNSWATLAIACAELRLEEFRLEIEKVFAEGLVESFHVGQKEILSEIALPEATSGQIPRCRHHSLITDVAIEMANWACFREDSEPAPPRSSSPAPKIGRNEPCPCGSGKKYKKCCLDRPVHKLLERWQRAPLSRSSCPDIDLHFVEAFTALRADDTAAIAAFGKAWAGVRARLSAAVDTLAGMETLLGSVFSPYDIVHEYGQLLEYAAFVDRSAALEGVAFASFLLDQFDAESPLFRENTRAQLGEFHFRAGDPAQGEEILSALIADLPHRSIGYAYLADVLGRMRFKWNGGELLDRPRALAILRKALDHPVEDAWDYDLEARLADMDQAATGV